MPQDLPIQYLSYNDLRGFADSFLARFHPSRTIPIPIEEIVDLQLQIDIIPLPGLRQAHDTEAFITSDMSAIYVDDYVYSSHPNRYRFSLAHEVAHAVMHQKVFRELAFTDLAGWLRSQQAVSAEAHGWLEWQAYAFAGLVLVPPDALRTQFDGAVAYVAEQGLSLSEASDAARRIIARVLARESEVSPSVIEKRLDKDSL